RDSRGARGLRDDGQDPRRARADEARPARPRAGGRARVRVGRRGARAHGLTIEMFSEALDAYLDAHATPLEPLLQENQEETYASLSSPQMIAGPVVGRLLRFLVSITAPRLVLEIGTFTGYSTLAMAGGLPPEGRIVTCQL